MTPKKNYLYSFANPAPADGSSPGGTFEIISDENGEIQRRIELEKRWLQIASRRFKVIGCINKEKEKQLNFTERIKINR